MEAPTGARVATATAGSGDAHAKLHSQLERRGTEAVIPPKAEPIRAPVPMRRLRDDARHDILW